MTKKIITWIVIIVGLVCGVIGPAIITAAAPSTTPETTNSTLPPETTEILVCPSEWFVTDRKPSQFTEEIYPPETVPIESTEPSTEPSTEATEPQLQLPPEEVKWYGDYRVSAIGTPITFICGEEVDREFLAKMLYAEAGAESWWGKVYTCSAILNHCEVSDMTLWRCGHNANHFAVASYVDRVTPTEECYEVVDYVLNGGRIEEICFFRTKQYHGFGTPVCQVDGHYFSME